jgi:prophage maintenance system killer protein
MENKVEIFKLATGIEINVFLEKETVWLTQKQMADLFETSVPNINMHMKSIFEEEELIQEATIKDFLIVQKEGTRDVSRNQKMYNLDVIISIGYRIKSRVATKFRQWATQRLKDYLVQGYAINEKRLAQKQMEVEYLKTGIRILNRALTEQTTTEEFEMLRVFAKGLELLDDYDHETLDRKGLTNGETIFPSFDEYMELIAAMYSEFESGVFAQPKDESFLSSINQIKQGFGDTEFYPSIEEKAANLLYFITKNHSFVDGNKRIAAACFLYFLHKNNALHKLNGSPIIDNATLAALTLFIATSKTDEAEIVKQLTISILNRNK